MSKIINICIFVPVFCEGDLILYESGILYVHLVMFKPFYNDVVSLIDTHLWLTGDVNDLEYI